MISLTPEQVAQRLAEYQQRKATLEAENARLAAVREANRQAIYEHMANQYKRKKTDKRERCVECNTTIKPKSVAFVRRVEVNVSRMGYTQGWVNRWTCVKCKEKKQ